MLKIEHNGYEHNISNWEPINDGEYMMCKNNVSLNGVEVCSIPGVMSTPEWNYGYPDENLLEQLYRNLVESGEFLANYPLRNE